MHWLQRTIRLPYTTLFRSRTISLPDHKDPRRSNNGPGRIGIARSSKLRYPLQRLSSNSRQIQNSTQAKNDQENKGKPKIAGSVSSKSHVHRDLQARLFLLRIPDMRK